MAATEVVFMNEIQLAKRIFDSFIRVFNIIKLYPEKSHNRLQAIAKFHSELAGFLGAFGFLPFEIQKKAVLYSGEVIHERNVRSGDFIFTLYRDGLMWIEFLDGVSEEELHKLFQILDEYTRPAADEPEADLLSTLWEAQLSTIVFQDALDEGDLLPPVEADSARLDILKEKSIPEVCSHLLSLPEDPEFAGLGPGDFIEDLAPDEVVKLEKMKAEENQVDPLAEVFGIIEYVCEHEQDGDLLVSVLDLLRDGIHHALNERDMSTASSALQHLRASSNARDPEHWACGIFETGFHSISVPECLSPLVACVQEPDNVSLGELRKFLNALHPEAVQVLIRLAVKVWSPPLREALMEAITTLAAGDIEQLERIQHDSDPNLLLAVMDVVRRLNNERAAGVLIKFLDHPYDPVVANAVKTLLDMDTRFPYAVFKLTDHQNGDVRKLSFEYLGSRKCGKSERLLLSYLESREFSSAEKGLAIECFKALGRCGSVSAYTYFLSILANRKWYGKIFKTIKSEGAALGLRELGAEPGSVNPHFGQTPALVQNLGRKE